MEQDLILYQFSRAKVERGDFRQFLALYGPERLPAGKSLRRLMNRLAFVIEGYDDDARKIHSIPEIRRFYLAFHAAWPYWLYFCNLDTEALRMMVFCCLPSLVAMQVDGRSEVAVEYDRLELVRFIANDFVSLNEICERAEMAERQIYDRTQVLLKYFDLPFEAQPPP